MLLRIAYGRLRSLPFSLPLVLLSLLPAVAKGQTTTQDLVNRLLSPVVSERGAQFIDIENGVIALRNGSFTAARELFRKAKEKNPQLAPGDVMLADLVLLSNDRSNARSLLEDAVNEFPDDPEAYIRFGEMAIQEGRVTDAEQLLLRGIELCDRYDRNAQRKRNLQMRALLRFADVAIARSDWDDAERHLRGVIDLEPESASAMMALARILYLRNEEDDEREAYRLLGEVYQLNRNNPRPEISMARLYQTDEENDTTDNVRRLLQLAIDRAGDDLRTRIAVAELALAIDDPAMAAENARAALDLDGSSIEAKLALGLAARYEGDLELAEEMYLAVHLQSPANFAGNNNLALTLIAQTDDAKRQRAAEFARVNHLTYNDANQQTSRDAAITLAWCLFALGHEGEAQNLIGQVFSAGEFSYESAYYAARILHDRGQVASARQLLSGALESGQPFPMRKEAQALIDQIPEEAENRAG